MKKVALIVEDDTNIQEILIDYLTSECGFDQVDVANDGLEGYSLAMQNVYDIITLDHKMPFFCGADLLSALRKKEGPNRETTIFFVSAFIPNLPQDVKETPNTYYIEKPIDFNRLNTYIKITMHKFA